MLAAQVCHAAAWPQQEPLLGLQAMEGTGGDSRQAVEDER